MNNSRQAGASASPPAENNLGVVLLRAAWLAIILGFAMEVLLLLVAAGFGVFSGLQPVAADLIRQVSWSTIVCVGLALGTAVSRISTPLMGIMGLLAAPLAFVISRGLHQGATRTLQVVGAGADAATPVLLIALLKGVEYACLGLAIGWLGHRHWGGVAAHAAVGLVVGILFGGGIVALTYSTAPETPTTAALLSQIVNEILFPVGCSLVLFSATALGRRMAR